MKSVLKNCFNIPVFLATRIRRQPFFISYTGIFANYYTKLTVGTFDVQSHEIVISPSGNIFIIVC